MDRFTGALGEHRAKEHFLRRGYEIYSPEIGRSSCDFVAIKDSEILRVEVKSSQNQAPSGRYVVKLKSDYSNMTQRTVPKKFDSSKCDVLVCYIIPTDVVHVLDAKDYEGRNSVTL